jgi:predicted amidophosphoribosyltransferase
MPFLWPKKSAINPNQRYIIVDDVFTTGSTLNACAATLRKAGAKRVDVLTLGHG